MYSNCVFSQPGFCSSAYLCSHLFLTCSLLLFYFCIDDLALGGKVSAAARDADVIITEDSSLDMALNPVAKFVHFAADDASLLGSAPLSVGQTLTIGTNTQQQTRCTYSLPLLPEFNFSAPYSLMFPLREPTQPGEFRSCPLTISSCWPLRPQKIEIRDKTGSQSIQGLWRTKGDCFNLPPIAMKIVLWELP